MFPQSVRADAYSSQSASGITPELSLIHIFFAKIVDYKSSFTSRHSIGVAEKASLLAKYMGYDSITVQKMYLAGACLLYTSRCV